MLRLVRTAIGPLRGPCEQDSEISAATTTSADPPALGGVAADLPDEEANIGVEKGEETCTETESGSKRWHPRLVERGQVLRVGEATLLSTREMDAFFALDRGGDMQGGASGGGEEESEAGFGAAVGMQGGN